MMDIKAMLDAVSDAAFESRKRYHLTLGGLQEALNDAPESSVVVFSDGSGAGEMDSYRGYYEDISVSTGEPASVSEWRDRVSAALSHTFIGYKGGEYPGSPDKPLWRSGYGQASGLAITHTSTDGGKMILYTRFVE